MENQSHTGITMRAIALAVLVIWSVFLISPSHASSLGKTKQVSGSSARSSRSPRYSNQQVLQAQPPPQNVEEYSNGTYITANGELCKPMDGQGSNTGGGGIPGSIPVRCRKLDITDMREHSLQMIRQDILRKLRMDESRLPNVSAAGFPIPPDYLSEFIGDVQGDSPTDYEDDEHATTEKIIAFSRINPTKIGKETMGIHQFTFSDKLSNMKIEGATLHVHVKYAGSNDKKPNFSIRLMELVQAKKGDSPILVFVGQIKPNFRPNHVGGTHLRHSSRSRWLQLDVKDALTKWMADSKLGSSKKIALLFEAVDISGAPSKDVVIETPKGTDVNNYPFIEVQVSEHGKSRQPRNLGMTCDENSQEDRCCRYPLTVDFEDFGWDWIIAPKKYDANYCSGKCPYAFLQKYPHNHIVQQANPSGEGGPCCAARKLSSISMLYFDENSNIVFSVLPGMVVDKCGCS